MGTWITHTRIAENLLGKIVGLDPTSFAFGNLAPDSGKPNADWSAFDPPKSVTHFTHKNKGEDLFQDLVFYQRYLQDFDQTKLEEYSFRLGYFFHLLVDNLWMTDIFRPAKQKHNQIFLADNNEAVSLFKRDWYTLDHQYLENHSKNIFWQIIMKNPNPPAYMDFIIEDSLHFSLDFIRDYYANPNFEIIFDRPFPYLTKSALDQFIVEASDKIYQIYVKIDQLKSLRGYSSLAMIE